MLGHRSGRSAILVMVESVELATQTVLGVARSRTGVVPTVMGLPTVLSVLGSSSQSWPGRSAVWSLRLVSTQMAFWVTATSTAWGMGITLATGEKVGLSMVVVSRRTTPGVPLGPINQRARSPAATS